MALHHLPTGTDHLPSQDTPPTSRTSTTRTSATIDLAVSIPSSSTSSSVASLSSNPFSCDSTFPSTPASQAALSPSPLCLSSARQSPGADCREQSVTRTPVDSSAPFRLSGPVRRKPLANAISPLAEHPLEPLQDRLPIHEEQQECQHEEREDDGSEYHGGLDYLDSLNLDTENLDSLDNLAQLVHSDDDSYYLDHIADDHEESELLSPDHRFSRPCSIDSPTLYEFPKDSLNHHQPLPSSLSTSDHTTDSDPGTAIAVANQTCHTDAEKITTALASRNSLSPTTPAALQTHLSVSSSQHDEDLTTNTPSDQIYTGHSGHNGQQEPPSADPTMSLFSRKSLPQLSLGTTINNNRNAHEQDATPTDQESVYSNHQDNDQTQNKASRLSKPNTLKPLPKSPVSASKLGSFFGWAPSPSTSDFSERGAPSPLSLQQPNSGVTNASSVSGSFFPSPNDAHAAGNNPLGYSEETLQAQKQHLPLLPSPTTQITEMEDELKAISAELASSIRREIDLEDLVERLQSEISNPQANKRTSDYYSDAGYGSTKALSDYDATKEEITQVQRRAEQERAQVRLELTQKLSEERTWRMALDQQVKDLSERAAMLDQAQAQRISEDVSGRVKQLEGTCEDLRRRLAEERNIKENFEDLLSAMKSELENTTNERDNLRDEVVPQLRARVEGLETQANEMERQTYETSKMQQELQTLKQENDSLRTAATENEQAMAAATAAAAAAAAAAVADTEFQLQRAPPGGLSRSNTLKGGLSRSNTLKGGLSRSNTVKQQSAGQGANSTINESREVLAERLRDVEAQRDALHSALKSLLERQEFQTRENNKKVRLLEVERERLMTASPRKAGYEHDVAGLRDEVGTLRRRAEEALEQKWQVEKGLSGLKMDLDRAEEEIANLRQLLQQNDILVPRTGSRAVSVSSSIYGEGATTEAVMATSASLESAYRKLQAMYKDALAQVQEMEAASGKEQDEKTSLAVQRLERALQGAEAERDAARRDVAAQQELLDATAASEASLLESERSLAEQLEASAQRVEELAQQVRAQLAANATLRDRLTAMVARGETEQRINKERIAGLEARLRTLEEQLVATQTAAEERVMRHEEQVTALHEAHSTQLKRLRDASGQLRAPSRPGSSGNGNGTPSLLSPTSPMFSINGRLVPSRPNSRASSVGRSRGSRRGSNAGSATSNEAEQQAQVATLRSRVSELELALASADRELQEVVGRMNEAQIQVMQVQEEREQAVRETRKLQRTLEAEQMKNFQERFRALASM